MSTTERGWSSQSRTGVALTWEDLLRCQGLLEDPPPYRPFIPEVGFDRDVIRVLVAPGYRPGPFHRWLMMFFMFGGVPDPAVFQNMEGDERLRWIEALQQAFGDEAVLALGLDAEALQAQGADPEYVAKMAHYTSLSSARHQAGEMIEEIGTVLGDRANLMTLWMLGNIDPPPPCWIAPPHLRERPSWPACPHLEPDLVWKLFRSFWHEVVHRGLEIGVHESHWIYGVNDFTYEQALYLVQNMWLAFKQVTGLDFTDPKQSAIIKSWFEALSPRQSHREEANDMLQGAQHNPGEEARRERLQHYIDYGGPSRKLMEERGEKLDPHPTVTRAQNPPPIPPASGGWESPREDQ